MTTRYITYDVDDYVNQIVGVFVDNLDTYVDCVKARKIANNADDKISPSHITDHFLEPDRSIWTCPLSFSYGFNQIAITDPTVGVSPREIGMFFRVNMIQNEINEGAPVPDILRWLLIYQEAMMKIVREKFSDFGGFCKPEITGLDIAAYELQNNLIRYSEVQVGATIG